MAYTFWDIGRCNCPVLTGCAGCQIPAQNLTLSWVNPVIGNGSTPLIYSAAGAGSWVASCVNQLIFSLICTGAPGLRRHLFLVRLLPDRGEGDLHDKLHRARPQAGFRDDHLRRHFSGSSPSIRPIAPCCRPTATRVSRSRHDASLPRMPLRSGRRHRVPGRAGATGLRPVGPVASRPHPELRGDGGEAWPTPRRSRGSRRRDRAVETARVRWEAMTPTERANCCGG